MEAPNERIDHLMGKPALISDTEENSGIGERERRRSRRVFQREGRVESGASGFREFVSRVRGVRDEESGGRNRRAACAVASEER